MRFLTHDDVAALGAAVDGRYRSFVYVAAYTGLRAGELIALRRSHVDLLRRTIAVVEQVQYIDRHYLVSSPKSAAGRRSVAMPRLVADELEEHLRHLRPRRPRASAALTLDRYGHLLPGQAESVAERLDLLARAAEPTPTAAVASIGSSRST